MEDKMCAGTLWVFALDHVHYSKVIIFLGTRNGFRACRLRPRISRSRCLRKSPSSSGFRV